MTKTKTWGDTFADLFGRLWRQPRQPEDEDLELGEQPPVFKNAKPRPSQPVRGGRTRTDNPTGVPEEFL